jgi:hypothetical protein
LRLGTRLDLRPSPASRSESLQQPIARRAVSHVPLASCPTATWALASCNSIAIIAHTAHTDNKATSLACSCRQWDTAHTDNKATSLACSCRQWDTAHTDNKATSLSHGDGVACTALDREHGNVGKCLSSSATGSFS